MARMDDLHRHALVFSVLEISVLEISVLEIRAAVCKFGLPPLWRRGAYDFKVLYTSTALVPIDIVLTGGETAARRRVDRQRRVFISISPRRDAIERARARSTAPFTRRVNLYVHTLATT